jgi:hypothetical protein
MCNMANTSKRRGRPKKDVTKRSVLGVRVVPSELQAMKTHADKVRNMKLSAWVLGLCRADMQASE